jgi:hypothetical protein
LLQESFHISIAGHLSFDALVVFLLFRVQEFHLAINFDFVNVILRIENRLQLLNTLVAGGR